MGNNDTDAFATIHRAAATDGDDHVAVVFPVQLGTAHHFLHPWVR